MVEKGAKGWKEEVVSREYTINLHKRLHGCLMDSVFIAQSKKKIDSQN